MMTSASEPGGGRPRVSTGHGASGAVQGRYLGMRRRRGCGGAGNRQELRRTERFVSRGWHGASKVGASKVGP
eukprot:3327814-Rhodomonas_salina.1